MSGTGNQPPDRPTFFPRDHAISIEFHGSLITACSIAMMLSLSAIMVERLVRPPRLDC
nr:hypothetical protein [Candidatus Sigynarchaeum springense]